MATRIDGDAVKGIIDTELTATQCEPFIESAHALIEQHLSSDSISDGLLKQIELWLSAHFVAIRDPARSAEKLGDAQDTFSMGELGKGLEFTQWGQQALSLDPTGKLVNVGKSRGYMEVL